ncbi:MAG TPA: Hsp20/alpha crystallin family protein [Smithellaceae bacterium]|nr:Hsp20/alpha crystallin family protein [Smithellaceae bacterium]
MNIIKIRLASNLEDEFQKAVHEVFNLMSPLFKYQEATWRPGIDVYESAEEVVVLADLAGMNKEELHVEIDQRRIRIAGARKSITEEQAIRYRLAEIPRGYFERNITLPDMVDAESAVASYADGVLMIRVNKIPVNKTHRITVTTNE